MSNRLNFSYIATAIIAIVFWPITCIAIYINSRSLTTNTICYGYIDTRGYDLLSFADYRDHGNKSFQEINRDIEEMIDSFENDFWVKVSTGASISDVNELIDTLDREYVINCSILELAIMAYQCKTYESHINSNYKNVNATDAIFEYVFTYPLRWHYTYLYSWNQKKLRSILSKYEYEDSWYLNDKNNTSITDVHQDILLIGRKIIVSVKSRLGI